MPGDIVTAVLPTLIIVGVLAAALGMWGLVHAIQDRPVTGVQAPGMGVVELALVVQTVVAAVGMSHGDTSSDPALLWSYLITQLVLLPIAFAWAFAERSRWSSVVLAVASLTIVVLQVRVWQIWQG